MSIWLSGTKADLGPKDSFSDDLGGTSTKDMRGLGEDRLQRDRRALMRALNDLEAGMIAGVPDDDPDTVRDLLILRIAKIDRQLREMTTQAYSS